MPELPDTSYPLVNSSDDPFSVQITGFAVPVDPERTLGRDPIDVAVTRFMDLARTGRVPTLADFCRQYPEIATELQELLPLVCDLEHWSAEKESECGRSSLPTELTLRTLGEFTMVREIGRGGMGVVLEATNPAGHSVAIKLLPLRFAADANRRRSQLKREANTLQALEHKNIVPVHSFGSHDGYWFYVMDLVRGRSLDWVIQRLQSSPDKLTAEELVRGSATATQSDINAAMLVGRSLSRDSWKSFAKIGAQAASGLSHAHSMGILHYDIKPSNLLLEDTGRVFLADFGVASSDHPLTGEFRAVSPQQVTEPGKEPGIGTLRYMAPERFQGTCELRSDIYSLGATLYELVTLAPLFTANSRRELVDQITCASIRPPRSLRPEIPVELENCILKALSPKPDERYESSKEFATDLMRFSRDEPVHARRPASWRRWLRWE